MQRHSSSVDVETGGSTISVDLMFEVKISFDYDKGASENDMRLNVHFLFKHWQEYKWRWQLFLFHQNIARVVIPLFRD